MKITIYIDVLILINTIINYIFIRLVAVATGAEVTVKKVLASSVIGSLFSIVIILDMTVLQALFLRIIMIVFCSFVSFGYENIYVFVKRNVMLVAVYMLFTGFLMAVFRETATVYTNNFSFYIGINPVYFVAAIFIFYVILSLSEFIFFREPQQYIYPVTVITKYGDFSATAFYDTGFKLKDLLCGNAVMMCSLEYLKTQQLVHITDIISGFYDTGICEDGSILPLFYSDISGSGTVAAIKTEKVIIKKNNGEKELKNIILAVNQKKFAYQHELLFGKDIYNRLGE